MQKTMLQHILLESHEQRQSYLFTLAAFNYAALEHNYRPTHSSDNIPAKFYTRLSLPEYDSPLWEKVLGMACQKINGLRMDANQLQMSPAYMRPLCMLVKAFNYSIHGVDSMFSPSVRVLYSLYKPELINPSLNSYFLLASVKVRVLLRTVRKRTKALKNPSMPSVCFLKRLKKIQMLPQKMTIGSAPL